MPFMSSPATSLGLRHTTPIVTEDEEEDAAAKAFKLENEFDL